MDGAGGIEDGRAPTTDGVRAEGWARGTNSPAARVVGDPATGRTWRVWAATCAHVPGAPADDCLVFDAGEVIRRVWSVPPRWPALSDAALLALAEAPPGRPHGLPRGRDDGDRTRPARAD